MGSPATHMPNAVMGLPGLTADMNKFTDDDLYEGVEGIISATDFMDLSEGAQTLFI